jgi:hypothetical protein
VALRTLARRHSNDLSKLNVMTFKRLALKVPRFLGVMLAKRYLYQSVSSDLS